MKLFKRIGIGLVVIILLLLIGGYIYLQSSKPQYSGSLHIKGLNDEVEVLFDTYGVPHIYAQTEEDAYLALGYVHAQERLFQMEMLTRVAGGSLSELVGEAGIKHDKFFRTIGLRDHAKKLAVKLLNERETPMQKAAWAYLDGINQFVEHGTLPVEYQIMGIPREKFQAEDIFLTLGFMAFGFAPAFRTDLMAAYVANTLGEEYLEDMMLFWDPSLEHTRIFIPEDTANTPTAAEFEEGLFQMWEVVNDLALPSFEGSNAWIISGEHTESGKPILCNDPHIKYGQPAVWYEAHLEYPGVSFYGNFLAGMPFGVIGHNKRFGWGLTMLANDEVDFYLEKINPENANQVWVDDHWEDMEVREEKIYVRGQSEPISLNVRLTRHGPMMFPQPTQGHLYDIEKFPISLSWAFTQQESKSLEFTHRAPSAQGKAELEEHIRELGAPGLNVMYADVDGNIAWWAATKFVKRPDSVNSKLFLDGASGKDDWLGYYDFSYNPRAINPPEGYIFTANHQPDSIKGILHPGYYMNYRAGRIHDLIKAHEGKWTVEDMKKMVMDDYAKEFAQTAHEIIQTVEEEDYAYKSPLYEQAGQSLKDWQGNHPKDAIAPTLFNRTLFYIYENAFKDELGQEAFESLIKSEFLMRGRTEFIAANQSIWWDDVKTKDIKESRRFIFVKAFEQAVKSLIDQFGEDASSWQWHKVHRLTHEHPLGRVKALASIFNVGPFGIPGAGDVINAQRFYLSDDPSYFDVATGPSARMIIDMADIEHAVSILPTGQSGNIMSPHYDDQAEMHNRGEFRGMLMNRQEIEMDSKGRRLLLSPE